MRNLYSSTLALHIFFGFIGLASFWVAVFAKKGGRLHIRVGHLFVYSMYLVCLTSFLTAGIVIYDPLLIHVGKDPSQSREFAVFLSFLGVLTLSTTWNGVRYIREKKNLLRLWSPLDVAINLATLLGGVAVTGIGFIHMNYLLIVFGALAGVTSGVSHFRFLIKLRGKPIPPKLYLTQHIESLIGAGIAVHTAFLAGGAASRYFPALAENTGLLFWFLPTVVGAYFQRKIPRKYA